LKIIEKIICVNLCSEETPLEKIRGEKTSIS